MGFEQKLSTAYWVYLPFSYAVSFLVCSSSYICQAENNMDPDQTAEKQSGQGSYCLLPQKDAVWSALEKQADDIFRTKENIGGITGKCRYRQSSFFYRSLLFVRDIRLDNIRNKFIYEYVHVSTSAINRVNKPISTFFDNCRLLSHLQAIWAQLTQVL